jgi:hypothetical protein
MAGWLERTAEVMKRAYSNREQGLRHAPGGRRLLAANSPSLSAPAIRDCLPLELSFRCCTACHDKESERSALFLAFSEAKHACMSASNTAGGSASAPVNERVRRLRHRHVGRDP